MFFYLVKTLMSFAERSGFWLCSKNLQLIKSRMKRDSAKCDEETVAATFT